jgi:hypothetical protein
MEDGQLLGGFQSHSANLLYCVGEVPAPSATFWYSCQAFLWDFCFMKVYVTQKNIMSMVGIPAKQLFRSWVWTVVKAIPNAYEDVVSKLTMYFYLFVFPVYITFYISLPYYR